MMFAYRAPNEAIEMFLATEISLNFVYFCEFHSSGKTSIDIL